MKFNSALLALSVSAILFSGMVNAAISGTDSVQMTFTSTVTTGTCNASVVNGAGTETAEIGFGDVYISDIANKTRIEPLKIKFTNCSGVDIATVAAKPGSGGGCSGPNSNGDSFAAGLGTGFEVWSGEADTGLMLSCKRPPAAQEVTITEGVGEFPMNSRIVVAKDRTISDVKTGSALAPVTFTVTYP
ncbi:fimbrial protein [Salmonella enterica subsp. enterica serovar Agbeni]|nr:fimbrial protein [Salmonella enterica subsp. enterica serovar Agbeni]EII7092847.1 fimbrial protein [Salmonella enterica subsp. enterica serovar Agbeni]